MNEEYLEGFSWHSSIGLDSTLDGNKRFVMKLSNDKQARSMFIAAGDDLLIHKTTMCLWKLSKDKTFIEPQFSSDVLSEEEVKMAMEAQQ